MDRLLFASLVYDCICICIPAVEYYRLAILHEWN